MSGRRERAVALVLVGLGLAAGCGKKGPPLPPLRPVPGPVGNVTARRMDGHIALRFTIPSTNTDRTSPAAVARVEIYARSAPAESPRPVKEQVVLRDNLVGTIDVKPPESDSEKKSKDKKDEETPAKPAAPPDTRPGAGDPVTFVEAVPAAAPTPLPPLTGKAAKAAQAAAQAAARAGGAGAGPAPGSVIPSRSPEARAGGAGAATPPPAGGAPAGAGAAGAGAAAAGAAAGAPPGTPATPAPKVPVPPTRYYWIQAVAPHGQIGPPPGFVAVPLSDVPAGPTALKIAYDEKTLTLTWKPAADGQVFQVYEVDKTGKEKDGQPLASAPLKTPEFQTPVVLGKEVCYAVRAVTAAGNVAIESDAAPPVCETPLDTFPPPPPTHLEGLPDAGAVNLRWDAVTASDLAGYLVLRGEGANGTLQPLMSSPITATSYSDTTVRLGVTYVYAIVAVDKSSPPNVSPQSNSYTVTIR